MIHGSKNRRIKKKKSTDGNKDTPFFTNLKDIVVILLFCHIAVKIGPGPKSVCHQVVHSQSRTLRHLLVVRQLLYQAPMQLSFI
jgi:hypothetical protein